LKKIVLLIAVAILFSACVEESAMKNYEEGRAALNNKNPDLAIEKFNKAISLDSNFAEAYERLAYAYLNKSEYDKARAAAEQALKIYPNSYKSLVVIGNSYFFEKNYEKALEYYDKAYKIDPYSEVTNSALALYYDGIGDCKNALPFATEALNQLPILADIHEIEQKCSAENKA